MNTVACVWLAWVGVIVAASTEPALNRYAFSQPQMGVPFNLVLYAPDEPAANAAAEKAFARIAELNGILSDYDPESELSRLSNTAGNGQAIHVSNDLWRVLVAAQDLSRRTDGAFDVTVGPLVRLWRRSRRQKELPSPERLAEARAAVGYQFVRLDEQAQTVELLKPNMRLDLGGIAMGYAVDEALKLLTAEGISSALLDASGDIGATNPPPNEKGWRIGIAPLKPEGPPSRYINLNNNAITTSGDAYQYVEINGVRYSHIIDPQTGLGLTMQSSVTVVAPTCIEADSLATAVSVLGHEKGLELIERTRRTSAMILRLRGDHAEAFLSQHFRDIPSEANSGRSTDCQNAQ